MPDNRGWGGSNPPTARDSNFPCVGVGGCGWGGTGLRLFATLPAPAARRPPPGARRLAPAARRPPPAHLGAWPGPGLVRPGPGQARVPVDIGSQGRFAHFFSGKISIGHNSSKMPSF